MATSKERRRLERELIGFAKCKADAAVVKERASKGLPLTKDEIECVVSSLCRTDDVKIGAIDWDAFRKFLSKAGHHPAKKWPRQKKSAKQLEKILGSPDSSTFQEMFHQVLKGGNWDSAAHAAAKRSNNIRPWVVLVSGLNGIRKTTAVSEPWFEEALRHALGDTIGPDASLPTAGNSFFRQLDFMVANLAAMDFKKLYCSSLCNASPGNSEDAVAGYSEYKAAIFSRYRTLAEMLGVMLIMHAKTKRMNIFVETSGRDIASFRYLDYFFPKEDYRKLVVNFSINELRYAESSVDLRMRKEMDRGKAAIDCKASIQEIIAINSGGPYGSQVLEGVQSESVSVWRAVKSGNSQAGKDWLKAAFIIHGHHDTRKWTAQPLSPDGSRGQMFEFQAFETGAELVSGGKSKRKPCKVPKKKKTITKKKAAIVEKRKAERIAKRKMLHTKLTPAQVEARKKKFQRKKQRRAERKAAAMEKQHSDD